jgi:branched-chain amino acid transport system permease protein
MMIVVGGLGSVHGAFLGAIFLISMPSVIGWAKNFLPGALGQATGLQAFVYGAILVAVVMLEPMGLYGRWLKVRVWLELFPLYRRGTFRRRKTFLKSERAR